jgi:HEAT repeat protein
VGYHQPQRRVEGDPAEIIHQAGELQQRELVAQLAASDETAFQVLLRAYQDARTTRLRCYILDALRDREDPRVVPLIQAGLKDSSSSVRGHAIEALLHRRDVAVCDLLLPLLRDSNAVIRCQAIATAAEQQCRSERTVAELLAGTRDPDWRIRQAAARSLGALGIHQAADQLHTLTDDPRNAVRVAAKEALERLGAWGG